MSLTILAGSAKGRALRVPDSARPSGVRLRKSLFDLLAARLEAGTFLDVYAGSGAVGLEAASRGYAVTLVEQNRGAVSALKDNIRSLGLRADVHSGDALKLLSALGQFDVVFCDPPYTQQIVSIAAQLLAAPLLRPGGLVIVQHPVQLGLPPAPGYDLERREYGSSALSLYTKDAAQP